MAKVTALMPMKGNSERVKDKNIRDFNGKPLFFHVLEKLLAAEYIGRVIINTDSAKITELIQFNFPSVEVVQRPEELCGDFVSMNKIIEHDISYAGDEYFIQTHSTNPLIKTETIDQVCKTLFAEEKNGYDSVFTVNRFQSRFYTGEFKPVNHNPKELLRTQDLPPLYEENSCLYAFSKEVFYKCDARIGENPFLVETAQMESIDIDYEDDFKLAELIHRHI